MSPEGTDHSDRPTSDISIPPWKLCSGRLSQNYANRSAVMDLPAFTLSFPTTILLGNEMSYGVCCVCVREIVLHCDRASESYISKRQKEWRCARYPDLLGWVEGEAAAERKRWLVLHHNWMTMVLYQPACTTLIIGRAQYFVALSNWMKSKHQHVRKRNPGEETQSVSESFSNFSS